MQLEMEFPQAKTQICKLKVRQLKNTGRNHSSYYFKTEPKPQLTVLVNKHAEGDTVGIKPIQKILDVTANERIKPKLLLVFNHSLCHCRNHIIVSVPDFNQNLQKAVWEGNKSGQSLYFMADTLIFQLHLRSAGIFTGRDNILITGYKKKS